jgi:hypothetical protein
MADDTDTGTDHSKARSIGVAAKTRLQALP